MEAIFEYEIDGIVYPEDNPPQQFIDALLNALKPTTYPLFTQAE